MMDMLLLNCLSIRYYSCFKIVHLNLVLYVPYKLLYNRNVKNSGLLRYDRMTYNLKFGPVPVSSGSFGTVPVRSRQKPFRSVPNTNQFINQHIRYSSKI